MCKHVSMSHLQVPGDEVELLLWTELLCHGDLGSSGNKTKCGFLGKLLFVITSLSVSNQNLKEKRNSLTYWFGCDTFRTKY